MTTPITKQKAIALFATYCKRAKNHQRQFAQKGMFEIADNTLSIIRVFTTKRVLQKGGRLKKNFPHIC